MVSSFRSLEKATGYQKFFRLGLYGFTGPDTLRLRRGCCLARTWAVDDVLGTKEVGSTVDVLEAPSGGNSLSFTRVSICASLSSADETLASDRWTCVRHVKQASG
jgi:hypothetical protein